MEWLEEVQEPRERGKGTELTMDAFRAVVGPAFSPVEGIEVLNVAVEPLLGVFRSVLLEAEVGEDAEPEPIGVGHAAWSSQ